MTRRRFALLGLTLTAAGSVGAALLSNPPAGAQSPAAPALDAAHAQSLYSEKCSACHNLPDPKEKQMTRMEWQRTVNRMLVKYKASDSISPPEAAQIVDYLTTFAVRPGARTARPLDLWATDTRDVWTALPSTSRVFNFEGDGLAPGLAAAQAGAQGPAAVWKTVRASEQPDGMIVKVVPVRPDPARFALLLDKSDQGRSVDVRVRFQMLGGTVSPSVGIAFGIQDMAHYQVLRYDAHAQTLSLLQMDGPTHTPLQVTPLTLPQAVSPTSLTTAAGQGQEARDLNPSLSLSVGPGWHTLRLLVSDGQVRGFLDQTKRVSVADPNYAGGKVGLWAQGDTLAGFDDWTVDIYDAPPPAASVPPAS